MAPLVREVEGLAAQVLANLGFEINGVRDSIDSVLGANERVIVQQIIPTSRVKKVIKIAFEEAKRMNNTYVGTERLLLAITDDPASPATRLLAALGVDVPAMRKGLGHAEGDPPVGT